MDTLNTYFLGVLSTLCLVCGVFFLRYWRLASDRFFLFFTIAFVALGLHWALLIGKHPRDEYTPYYYLLRLFAFLLIVAAIVDKNRRSSTSE